MIFTAHELAEATGGRLARPGPAGPLNTDSRRLRPGDWFVALSGERFDGHDYLPHAAAAGCAGCIALRAPDGWDRGFIQVDDALKALQDVARYVRRGFPGPVVGITGSAGKTTTRAMAALALSGLGKVHQTSGNLNNHIGVPLTILHAPVDAAAWVLEMGMNHLGEIDLLQDIGQPSVRLITNVGAAHLEGVGSIEGVARAKGELFAGARPGDVCCVNADDGRVAALPIPEGARALRYGRAEGCAVRLTDVVLDAATFTTRYRVEIGDESALGRLPAFGEHLALGAVAAIAVGHALRRPLAEMVAALARYEPVGARQRVEAGPAGMMVINDAYNANPLSTAAALRALAAVEGRRKVALLGDMLELGSGEADAHREALALALSLPLDLVGLAGPRYAAAWEALGRPERAIPSVISAADAPSLAAAVTPRLAPGDAVLLKGSRGLAMERILPYLHDNFHTDLP